MKRYCRPFTLIELITAMAVFVVLMGVMMKFFQEAQQAWSLSSQRAMVYDNARVAMDLITRDLQAAYYKKDVTPFWHSTTDVLGFISATPMPQVDSTSPFHEVQYKLEDDWLKRSVTGNQSGNFDYHTNFDTAFSTREDFVEIVPYVTDLKFTCYNNKVVNPTIPQADIDLTNFPFIVMVELTLLDKNSWEKWKAFLAGSANDAANALKENQERTFTKMIFMGERGQSL